MSRCWNSPAIVSSASARISASATERHSPESREVSMCLARAVLCAASDWAAVVATAAYSSAMRLYCWETVPRLRSAFEGRCATGLDTIPPRVCQWQTVDVACGTVADVPEKITRERFAVRLNPERLAYVRELAAKETEGNVSLMIRTLLSEALAARAAKTPRR